MIIAADVTWVGSNRQRLPTPDMLASSPESSTRFPGSHQRSEAGKISQVLLKACLNGPRSPAEHQAIPATPGALARDVALVATAGVGAVHFHAKNAAGFDTLEADDLAAALVAARSVRPTVPLGVTTGAWAVADPKERATLVHTWAVLPDFASVNWHEPGAEALTAALLERGIGVEAGLWHEQAVETWLASPHRDDCFRVLLELPDGLDAADSRRNADTLLAAVTEEVRDHSRLLLHGEGSSCWPVLQYAAERGLATRIGLEDTLELPDGSIALDNLALVRAAFEIIRSLDPSSYRRS
jgi:uncharacterized protein (DUF849 family)